jgi:hypothetical protein
MTDAPAQEAATPASATTLAREFATLKHKRDEIESHLDVVKARMAQIEPVLLDFFASNDMQSLKIGGIQVYVQRQVFASAPDKPKAVRALKTAGLKELVAVGFNTNSISALFREYERDGVTPHPALRAAFTLTERFSIRARKA